VSNDRIVAGRALETPRTSSPSPSSGPVARCWSERPVGARCARRSQAVCVTAPAVKNRSGAGNPHSTTGELDARSLFRCGEPCIPAKGEPMIRWILSSLLLVACSSAIPASRKPDGSWHLTCGPAMDRCVQHAEELCKGRGYVVLAGMSRRKLYGAELGVSQVEVREAELDIACADRRGDLPTVQSAAASPAPAPAPAAPAPAAPAPAAPAPAAPAPAAPAPAPAAPAPASSR